ncbi:MAG: hypothetical protein Q8O88_02755 [bacterium]|nr:hypothetical protein [bacterium]
MSLDRLINLARKTGDRLIVHQPDRGEDIVIMDVDEYELLFENRRDVRNLSDKQLLDQINRDIAIWRANDKFDRWYDDVESEDEIPTGVGNDFESEKEDDTNWFSAGNVLEDKFAELNSEVPTDIGNDPDLDLFEDFNSGEGAELNSEVPMGIGEIPTNDGKVPMEIGNGFFNLDEVSENEVENVKKFEIADDLAKLSEPEIIPHKPFAEAEGVWEEESLGDDEPVFYEEPV